MRRITGYVEQEDILDGTQTVLETLNFYARLKLPNNLTSKQRKERVNNMKSLKSS